jgi:hypothetical protein
MAARAMAVAWYSKYGTDRLVQTRPFAKQYQPISDEIKPRRYRSRVWINAAGGPTATTLRTAIIAGNVVLIPNRWETDPGSWTNVPGVISSAGLNNFVVRHRCRSLHE